MADFRELEKPRIRAHTLHIDNRSRISVTGVADMESFHEQEIVLLTEEGSLRIEGEGMHIAKLSLDEGQVVIEGEVTALEYEQPYAERKGLFSRVFR